MDKSLPNKWVRKAIGDALAGLEVDGHSIDVYDERVTGPNDPDYFILLTSQTNTVDKNNKCEWFWIHNITIDTVCVYPLPGNPGSNLLIDDIQDAVRANIEGLQLDPLSELKIITRTQSYPNDLNLSTDTEVVYRKLIILELLIK